MNNLRKFNWITQYNSAKEGEELVKPSVSLVIDKAVVIYDDDISPIYRWINLDPSEDYECDMEEHIKYYKQKKQVSLDNGATWNDVVPAGYRRGDIYEEKSTDCGYIPKKLTITYHDGSKYEADCESSSSIITSADTHPNGYDYSAMTFFEIGECVTELGDDAFGRLPSTMKNAFGGKTLDLRNVVTLGKALFTTDTGGADMVFGEIWLRDVTSMSDGALASCICDFVIDNTTPPAWILSQGIYPMPPYYYDYSIYVPDSAVEIYKANRNWKRFKDRIKPISQKPS